ncbi:MAG: hypothetical protein LBE36_08355 [Flavobacteriaceae bacterium]|jgi:hypothetical protein|nr:hypothetical protein [Flavobacteriaceae bacterium]
MNKFIKAVILVCAIGSLFISCKNDDDNGGTTPNPDQDITSAFTDPNFKAYCLANFDAIGGNNDGKLQLSEVNNITELHLYNKNITSLEGIGYFTGLTFLDCSFNKLTVLDVSKNTVLTELWCFDNQLSALDISKNAGLTELRCYNNQLSALDVSKNTALNFLGCYNNQLTTLDLSKNTVLTQLSCHTNQLATLNVSKNMALTILACSKNKLATLDVNQNTDLIVLNCSENQLTALDTSKNKELTYVDATSNSIDTIYVWFSSAPTIPAGITFKYDANTMLEYKP